MENFIINRHNCICKCYYGNFYKISSLFSKFYLCSIWMNEWSLNEVFSIIELLLRRGADPSICVPYSSLCFAVAAGDLRIVKLLLQKGADSNKRMPKQVKQSYISLYY